MDNKNFIQNSPDILLGKPVIKGQEFQIALILKKLSEGAIAQDLIEAYPNLSEESIWAALTYASDAIANKL